MVKAELDSSKLRVVVYRPWQRPVLIAAVGLLALVCLAGGYWAGQLSASTAEVSGNLLAEDLDRMRRALMESEDALVDAELSANVNRAAADTLRRDMQKQHREVLRLQEEVVFYKSLMAPGALPKGLQVTELELTRAGDDGVFTYELLLTQVALRRNYISGEVRFDVIGHRQGDDSATADDVVLSLTELAPETSYPLKFKFRYFQDLKGRIVLPDDFVPARVLVTANQSGKDPVQASFPWPGTA